MKRSLFVLLLSISLFSYSFANDFPETRKITVSGQSEIKVQPNRVVYIFGIENTDKDMANAKNRNSSTMQSVINKLLAIGITKEDISTSAFSIYPRFNYNSSKSTGPSREFVGYEVRNTFKIVSNDIKMADSILETAIEAGITNVNSVSFEHSQYDDYLEKARSAALLNAKKKANSMAEVFDASLGVVLTIEEPISSYSVRPYNNRGMLAMSEGAGGNSDSSFSVGEITISQNVIVSFSLVFDK